MSDLAAGLLSGVVISLIALLGTTWVTAAREKKKEIARQRQALYFALMDVHGLYFWVVSAEANGQKVKPEIGNRIWERSWKLADLLRESDDVPEVGDLLDLVHSGSYSSAAERYQAMGKMLSELGKKVNPNYLKRLGRVSDHEKAQAALDLSPYTRPPMFLGGP